MASRKSSKLKDLVESRLLARAADLVKQEVQAHLEKVDPTLHKTMPGPRFPKLGISDDRRETPIISTPTEMASKARVQGSRIARHLESHISPSQRSSMAFNATAESHAADARRNAGQAAVPTTGPTVAGFAKDTPLRSINPEDLSAQIHQHPNAAVATREHENFHQMMNRVHAQHGADARVNLGRRLFESINPDSRLALQGFTGARPFTPKTHPLYHEEMLASLLNYLNNPGERAAFHQYSGNSVQEAREYDAHMKQAHRDLLRAGAEVDRSWLHPVAKSESLAKDEPGSDPDQPEPNYLTRGWWQKYGHPDDIHHDIHESPELWARYRDPDKLLDPKLWHGSDQNGFPDNDHLESALVDLQSDPFNQLQERHLEMALRHPRVNTAKWAALHPKLSSEAIDRAYAGSLPTNIAANLAANPNLTPEQVNRFLGDESYIARMNAARHPKLDPRPFLENPHPDEGIQEQILASHPTPEVVNHVVEEHPGWLTRGNEFYDKLTPEHISKFLEDARSDSKPAARYGNILDRLTQHPLFTSEHHRIMAAHPNPGVGRQEHIVKSPYATTEELTSIANDDNAFPETRQEAKDALEARDPDRAFQESVDVAPGLSKLRKLRDLMEERGVTELHPKEFPGDFSQVRGRNGNLSLDLVNKQIAEAPRTRYNVSHDTWHGAQRHTGNPSNVFQVNLTTDQVKRLKEKGAYPSFHRLHEASFSSGHPVGPHTIGWVRWTGDPNPSRGIHVDEVQSDFGQQFSKQITSQARQHATQEADRKGLAGQEHADYVKKRASELAAQGAKELPDEHWKHISDTVFGGRPANEVLLEAFRQHLRDKGNHNAPLHIHSVETKGPISLPSYGNKPVPGHFNDTYNKMPQRLGMEPHRYGELKTQTNPKMKGKPVWGDVVRKSEDHPDEVFRMLAHPDPIERLTALRLAGVRERHLLPALLDPDQAVQDAAVDHPELGDEVISHVFQNRTLSQLQRRLLNHRAVQAHHLAELYRTHAAPAPFPVPESEDILKLVADHPLLGEDLMREMAGNGDADLVVRHSSCPQDVLTDLMDAHQQDPEHPEHRALAGQALQHPGMPDQVLESVLAGGHPELRMTVAGSSRLPLKAATDVVRLGQIATSQAQAEVPLRIAILGNPRSTHEMLQQGLRDHSPEVRAAAEKRLGLGSVQKAEDLDKGAMQRLAPFNPAEVPEEERDTLHQWQDQNDPGARSQVPRMEGPVRTRALHWLSGATQTRQGRWGREFLLHRGMSRHEYDNTVNGNRMVGSDDQFASWTPRLKTAESFAGSYGGPVVSAWVPEHAVHSVPKQLGSMAGRKGINDYRHEHEVVVSGDHQAEVVPPPVARANPLTSIHERVNQAGKDNDFTSNPEWKIQQQKQRLAHRGVNTQKSEPNSVLEVLAKSSSMEDNGVLGSLSDGTLERALAAGRFLSGKEVSPESVRRAVLASDGDEHSAALRAHGLDHGMKESLKRVAEAMPLPERDDHVPEGPCEAAVEDAGPAAASITRALERSEVVPVSLGGKHSKGTLLAKDPESKVSWLLKPGSGRNPASGADEDPSSQSQREAAFYHVAAAWKLTDHLPEAQLVRLGGKEYAAIKLLPLDYRDMNKVRAQDKAAPAKILDPYLRSGLCHRWGVLDYVLGQVDRHAGNVLTNGEDVQLIDEGGSMAGQDFDPANDPSTFTPFYLRAWSAKPFDEMEPAERLRAMPRIGPEQAGKLADFIDQLDPEVMTRVLVRYGVDPNPAVARLAKMRESLKKYAADDAVNRVWCEKA